MKTIFYLPLIAIILFCSCKSSFTTQRYTHFKHSSAKKAAHQPEVAKAAPVAENVVAVEAVEPQLQKESFLLATVGSMKETILALKPVSSKNLFNPEELAVDEDYKVVNKGQSEQLSSTVTVNEKSVSKRGIIGSALETAIYIVLVVIFICLIIFLLSVVF